MTGDHKPSLRRVCVIGWPVEHSRSPLIHNHWIKTLGIPDAVYERLPVRPEEFGPTLAELPHKNYIGANVTVPHKEAAFRAATRLDAAAARLQAVNTIIFHASGEIEGRNTDGYGFLANLREKAPNWTPKSGPATILGAGGAARAIVAALADAGVPEIRLVNRTRAKAEALAHALDVPARIFAWDDHRAALADAKLLVNTTSLGMTGMAPLDIPLDTLPTDAVVNDIVYVPLRTGLLQAARSRGNPTVDGLGMLLHQAVPGFEAWFGVRPQVTTELRHLILRDLGETD